MTKKLKRRHPQPSVGPRKPGLDEILSRVRALQEKEKYEEALQVLDEAPPHLQRRPELLLTRGLLLASLGDLDEAMLTLEEVRQRDPDNPLILYLLGVLYDEMDMKAHAWHSLQEFMEHRHILPGELVEEVQGRLDALQELLSYSAKAMEVSLDTAVRAIYEVELGTRAAEAGDMSAAFRHLRQASALAPRWSLPRGIEGEFLLMDGQPRKAAKVAEQMLKDFPELYAPISILVRAYLALGNREAAEAAAQPLRSLSLNSSAELESAVITLGYLNDDEGIYRLYRQHRHLVEEIEGLPVLIALGSAAANLGHFGTARSLWGRALSYHAESLEVLSALLLAANRKAPGPGIADRYPTFQFAQLMPHRATREMTELLTLWNDGELDQKFFRKRLRGLIARYPLLFSQLIQFFRESKIRPFWIEILTILGTPEAVEELRRFAFSPKGRLADRLLALQSLEEAGLMEFPQPVELWDEFRQEWRLLRVPRWRIQDPEPDRYPPQAMGIVREVAQALQEGRLQDADELTKKVFSLAPNNPDLYSLLAPIWAGDAPRAEAYLRKAVELDPLHAGGWAGLALIALNRGDLLEARRCTDVLANRLVFTLWELTIYLQALILLSMREKDLTLARFYVDSALALTPEDERLQQLDQMLSWQEPDSSMYLFVQQSRQRQERKRNRPIPPDASLRQCLERLTRESLTAMARVYWVPYVSIRKAQLIQNLVEAITDPAILREAVAKLEADERQALRDVLDAGGILPWDEFTARYGNDVEDSQEWYYALPETLMGRLRLYGLLSDGTVEGQRVVLIPQELRELLPSALSPLEEAPAQKDDAV